MEMKWKLALMLCVSIIFNFQFSIFNSATAQSRNYTITGDVTVNAMVERHIEFNYRVKTIPGFRAHIPSPLSFLMFPDTYQT